MCFFITDKREEFIHLCVLNLFWNWCIWQLLGMGLGPIRNALMVNTQLATNSPQIHPIHIELHCLHTKRFIVTIGLLLRRIFTTTQITSIALAPRRKLAYFVLLFFTSTFWTFHLPILPTLSPLPL